MKRNILFSILALGFTCATMKAQVKKTTNNLDFKNYKSASIIKLKKGKTVALKIEENPSTGYSWKATPDKNCSISITKDDYKQNDAPERMVGVPGVRTLEIYGKKSGKCKIVFTNLAPGGRVEETKSLIFAVSK